MSCKSLTLEYTEILKNLIKNDSKYTSYDNVASLVLSNDSLDNEQKKMAIHYFASIYKNLVKVDSKTYSAGKLQQVLDKASMLDNTKNYLQKISDVYIIKPESIDSKKTTVKNKLESYQTKLNVAISISNLQELFKEIDVYFNTNSFETEDDYAKEVNNFKELFQYAIEVNGGTKFNKKNLNKLVLEKIESLKKDTSYVDINQFNEEFKNTQRRYVILKDGRNIEAIEQDGGLFEFDYETLSIGKAIPTDAVSFIKEIRPSIIQRGNRTNGEIVVLGNSMNAGFRIRAIDGNEDGELHKTLREVSPNRESLSIKAVRTSDIGDQRVKQLHTKGEENPSMSKLKNRKYETFESPAQIELLNTDKNAQIITVRRPSKDDQIAFTGTIKGTTYVFNLFNLDNFTIVDSNNNTIPFDFNNPQHIELLKEKGLKNTYLRGAEKLSTKDIDNLIKEYNNFQEFKTKALSLLEGKNSQDVTDLFFDLYEARTSRPQLPDTPLQQKLEQDQTLSIPVTVVTVDKKNQVIKDSEEKGYRLPIHFTKSYNKATGKFDYVLKSIIPKTQRFHNKRILDADGNPVTETKFITDYLLGGKKDATWNDILDPLFKHEYEKIKKGGVDNSPRFILQKKANGFGYRSVNYVSPTFYGPGFLSWSSQFTELDPTKPSSVVAFDKAQTFNFLNMKGQNKGAIKAIMSSFNGKLILELRDGGVSSELATELNEYVNSKEVKSSFNIDLTKIQNKLKERLEELDSKYISKVIEENDDLKFDLNDVKARNEFYNKIYEIYSEYGEESPKELLKLVKRIEQLSTDFSNTLATTVDNTVKNNFRKVIEAEAANNSTKLIDILKKYYVHKEDGNSIDNYNFKRLVVNENSGVYLSILQLEKASFNKSINFINVYEGHKAEYTISSRKSSKNKESISSTKRELLNKEGDKTSAEKKSNDFNNSPAGKDPKNANVKKALKDKADKSKAKAVVKGKNTSGSSTKKIDANTRKKRRFSIEAEADTTTASLPEAAEWLGTVLPQFELSKDDVGDMVDLSTISGHVLGMYKDKVIYLNKSLAGAATLYHEAFHGVFRGLMTADQRTELIQAVLDKKTHASKFTKKAVLDFARERGYNLSEAEVKKIIAEEILADGFKEYMVNNKKPKNLLGKFFEILKKLIRMFSKYNRLIDSTFKDINTGKYTNKVYDSSAFKGQYALESIPGLVRHFEENGEYYSMGTPKDALTASELNNLINVVSSKVIQDKSNRNFDEKFEDVVDLLIRTYDINSIVEDKQNAGAIKAKWTNVLANYRFMLGARLNEEKYGKTYDTNLSENNEFDKFEDENKIKLANGKEIDNTLGAYSKSLLKKQVKKSYDAINTVELSFDEQEDLQDVLNGEASSQQVDVNDDSKDETENNSQSGSFEDGFGNENVVNQIKYVRSTLATIEIEQPDELGVVLPKVVDAIGIFPVLLKVTSGLDVANTINHIKVISDQLLKDGFLEEHYQLKAIYDRIVSDTGMSEASEYQPTKNEHIYDMFVEVLHNVELDYTMFELTTPQKLTLEQIMGGAVNSQKHRVDIKDNVISSDTRNMRNEFINSMLLKFLDTNKEKTEAHRASVKELLAEASKIVKNDNLFFDGTASEIEKVKELTDKLDKLFNDIGLNFPKSLIELSIIGIESIENEQGLPVTEDLKGIYDLHESVIEEKKYLEKDFFRSLQTILNKMYLPSGNKNTGGANSFASFIEEDATTRDRQQNIDKNRFLSILRKSSEYVIKYNPQKIQSVIKNAEGKNIYRYAKYNPLIQVSQMIKRKGLKAVLEMDTFYTTSLKEWMNDHPVFGEYLKRVENEEELTKGDLALETFLKNINVSMLGGVQQRVGNVLKEGKSFKGVDAKSLYLIHLASFMNRDTVLSEDGETVITLYKKQFHQLESTQTNFLVNAIYKSFIDNTSKVSSTKDEKAKEYLKQGKKLYEGKYQAIVQDLVGVIAQEYKRIQREQDLATDRVESFKNNEENQLVLNYNAKYDKKNPGEIITNDKSLRAFRFNRFQTFWSNASELQSEMYELINDGIKFEEIDEQVLNRLKLQLDSYANSEYLNHLAKLEKNGVITPIKKSVKKAPGQPEEIFIDYNSPYLSKSLKTGYKQETVLEKYSSKNIDLTGVDSKDSGLNSLIYDAFMNSWYNTFMYNQIFDGDPAMGTKNDVDYVKRLKKFAAAGLNMKEGEHTVAYLNTIEAWTHNDLVSYGPYVSVGQIENDPLIKDNDIKTRLIQSFNTDLAGTTELGTMHPIFDGQSISSLMHQMDQYKTFGRLTPRVKDLLIAKHYRELTLSEIQELQKMRVAVNSKKTVTAGRSTYLKLSEYAIDRNEVSEFVHSKEEGMNDKQYEDSKKAKLEEIHNMYSEIYNLRKDIQDNIITGNFDTTQEKKDRIKELVTEIHKNYTPLPHRVELHNILNSMEYHQIDQLVDTEASKNAMPLPIDLTFSEVGEGGYINLELASHQVPNSIKYLQVETSGVKEKAKVGVQKKVLLPADVPLLLSNLNQKENFNKLSATEKIALKELGSALSVYNSTLKQGFDARFEYLKNVIRKGENLDVAKMYKLIQQSLIAQNAPIGNIQLFDVKEKGVPAVNPNLPVVRKMVEYFFFSHYSQHVTDEQAAGFKSFHVSQFGYNVISDKEGNVITTDEYKKNTAKYNDPNEYTVRPLGVSVEIDEKTGEKTYWTEAIVPMPSFETEEQKQWYMDNMRKAFGTRIPTEDKRSMIALKIVDFVDSSKLNTVIVPQYVHILAGSDFDIDSLFGQMYSTYTNAKGSLVKYGDVSGYKNKEAGEFVEFLHYMASKPEFKSLISKERTKLYEDKKEYFYSEQDGEIDLIDALDFEKGSAIWTLLNEAYGFTDQEIEQAQNLQAQKIQRKEVQEEIDKLYKEKQELKEDLFGEQNTKLSRRLDQLQVLHEQLKETSRNQRQLAQQQKESKGTVEKGFEILNYAMTYVPIVNVLSEFAIPITFDSYKDSSMPFSQMVAAKYQNQNLEASLKMLSNEVLFNELYIKEKTSDVMFDEILQDVFGITVEDVLAKGDINTIDSVVESKVDTSSFKDGIGISANINKFLSIASSYQLELNDTNTIWSFNKTKNGKLEKVSYDKFYELNEQQQRPIQIIGGMLGVFADAVKKPIPTALQLNEVNTNVALVMASLGLDPGMVMGFGFIPQVKNAIAKVKEAQEAISEDFTQQIVWYNQALENEVLNILAPEDDKGFRNVNENWNLLKSSGLISFDKKNKKENIFGKWDINTDNLVIDFEYKKSIDINKLKTGSLSLSEIGFNVTTTNGLKLGEELQASILLKLYAKQASQIWDISKATKFTNFHKRLNPDLQQFDKTVSGIEKVTNEKTSIFTKESISDLIGDNSVYKTIQELTVDMEKQLKSIFLERQDSFFTIKELYGEIYQDKSQLSNVFVGVMASTAYFNSILNSELSEEDKQDEWYAEQKEKEKEALLEILDTKNLFTGKLSKELTEMKEKYPDNKFLQKLSSYAGSAQAILTDGEKESTVKESNIKLLDKVKLKDNLLDDVKSDLNNLMSFGLNERLFVKKLFWNEIIRTGSQINVPGSYVNLFPQEFQTEYSEKLNDVLSIFNYGNRVVKTGSKEFFANGKTFNTEQEAIDFIKDNKISIEGSISAALGENYKNVLDTILNKLALEAIKDSANSNISKSKAIKLGVGEAKDNYKFRSGFVKAVQNNYKIDDPTKLKEASLVHIEKVFGIKINREALAKDRVKQLFINDPRYVTTTNDKITVKVNPAQYGLNYQTADIIGGKVKFEPEIDAETGEAFTTMKMIYPTLFSVGNEYYQLTSVDNKPITEAKDVILPNNTGNEATYVKVNKTMLDSTSNGIAVSNENANEYTSYSEQSRKIKIEKTALEQTVVDPGTQPQAKKLDIATLLTNGLVNTAGLEKIDVEDAEVFTKQVFTEKESEQVFNFIEQLYNNTYNSEHKANDKLGKVRRSMYFSDESYTYKASNSEITRPANLGSPELQRLVSKITKELGFEDGYFDMVLINEYKDGTQKIGFHTDNEQILNNKGKLNPSVVTISFGDKRTMVLKGKKKYEIPMESGLGLIMGKDGQINYQHGINAEGNKSKRFSITLRHNAEKSQAVDKVLQPAQQTGEVEISSNAKGLAAALTNPTELAKSKGNLAQSYPVKFNDKTYKDVEQAYQKLKDKSEAQTKPTKENSGNYTLMVDLITAKLQQHPRLVSEITKKGGSSWISSSTHQPTKQNTVWETGGQNWFIEALDDAYQSAQPAQQNIAIKYFEGNITPEPNTVFVFGSNPIGVNGNPARGTGGAALDANQQFGVKQGEKMTNKLSDSGKAFGLVTVTRPGKKRSVSPSKITEGVKELYKTALANPNKQFKVAYRNTTQRSLNGYTGLEMIEMFNAAGTIPSNVVFSKEWFDTGNLNTATKLSSTVQLQTEIKIPYKYQGKTQKYTIKGTQIFNKDGKEVFASKSKDRLKIFANFAILQGRAEVVEITQKENNVEVNKTYVVNNKNQVMSTVTGNEIKAKDIVTKAIAAADVIRARKAEGNPNNVNKPDQEDIDNCMG